MYIGHDVELAVMDAEGKAVPAHRFFPPKTAPVYTNWSLDSTYHRDGYFRDGTNLELNTAGNVACCAHLLRQTIRTIQAAKAALPKGYSLVPVSAYPIDLGLLKAAPVDVLESGCSPVKNAYVGWEDVPAYMDPENPMRCAGGHIHIGAMRGTTQSFADEKEAKALLPKVVKWIDVLMTVPYLYMGLEGKMGKERRKYYGKAGEFRWQKYTGGGYGLEYRVLGPEWIKDIHIAGFVVQMIRQAFAFGLAQSSAPDAALLADVRAAINEGDTTEIFKSPAWQKVFENWRTVRYISQNRLHLGHFNFLREVVERGELNVMTLDKFVGDTHFSWPDAVTRGVYGDRPGIWYEKWMAKKPDEWAKIEVQEPGPEKKVITMELADIVAMKPAVEAVEVKREAGKKLAHKLINMKKVRLKRENARV